MRHHGVRWALVPDAPLPSAPDGSFPLHAGRSRDRGNDADPVADDQGRGRAKVARAGQRSRTGV